VSATARFVTNVTVCKSFRKPFDAEPTSAT
jgi:hypothetical protein